MLLSKVNIENITLEITCILDVPVLTICITLTLTSLILTVFLVVHANMLKNNHTATAFFCALADMALPIEKPLYAHPRIYSAAYYFPVSEQKKLELEFEL